MAVTSAQISKDGQLDLNISVAELKLSALKPGRVPLHFAADYSGLSSSPVLSVTVPDTEPQELMNVDMMTGKTHVNVERLTEVLAREHDVIDARLFVCSPSLATGCEYISNPQCACAIEVQYCSSPSVSGRVCQGKTQ